MHRHKTPFEHRFTIDSRIRRAYTQYWRARRDLDPRTRLHTSSDYKSPAIGRSATCPLVLVDRNRRTESQFLIETHISGLSTGTAARTFPVLAASFLPRAPKQYKGVSVEYFVNVEKRKGGALL
jgi:hypothetical protein